MNKKLKQIIIIAIWIVVWGVIAFALASPLVLAKPSEVLTSLFNACRSIDFWLTVVLSLLRIFIGSLTGAIIGMLLAFLSYKITLFKDFISPVITFLKAAPIVCFIVLLLMIIGVDYVDIVTVIIAILPIYYFSFYEALNNRNINIANMLKVHRVPKSVVFRVFEWPSALPYIKSATKSGIGIAWKSGVTAQMIGAVDFTIGTEVYNAKLYLASDELIMWMIITILLSFICEKVFITAINGVNASLRGKLIEKKHKHITKDVDISDDKCSIVSLKNINVTYGKKEVIKNYSMELKSGERIAYCDNTGAGKTTLINAIMGLIVPDSGAVNVTDKISAIFQENTLLKNLNVCENISIVTQKACNNTELIDKNIKSEEMSGGMKRLAQIERAMMCESDLIIMDEPFTGLDTQAKTKAIDFINSHMIKPCGKESEPNKQKISCGHGEQNIKTNDETGHVKTETNNHLTTKDNDHKGISQDKQKSRALILITHDKEDAKHLKCRIERL